MSQIKNLNKRGLIPGPQESDEEFWKRVELSAKTHDAWQETHAKTAQLFDFSLDWVEIFYSKKRLPFWQGALTWLETIPKIQLHPRFQKGSLLKLYKREDVLAHEAVHVARSQFYEPRFEEHFAYLTSERPFERYFGPCFRTAGESTLFLALISISMIGTVCGFPAIALASCAAVALGLARLALAHKTFNRCKRNLALIVREPLALMVRLTDKEIALFAKSSEQEILSFTEKQPSLRWQMLLDAYFN